MFRVLYVDDELDLLDLGKIYLETSKEFTVDTSTSAKDVLNTGNLSTYDAIVSDYQMPGMDGIEFLKEVRSRFGDIPFILFTGRGREEVVIEAINNGADFYLQKGGDPKAQFAELMHKIRKAVERKRADEALYQSEDLFRSAMNQLPGTVWVVDRGLRYTLSQGAGLAFIGMKPDQAVGMTLYEFFGTHDPSHPAISHHLRALAGETVRYEYTLEGVSFGTFLSSLHDPQGKITGVIGIAFDITDRKRAEEALKKKVEELSQFNTLTVDRELRMIDLKKEINTLRKQAGKQEKYRIVK